MNARRLALVLAFAALAAACGGAGGGAPSSLPAQPPPVAGAPVADAGAAKAVTSGASVALDGSGSIAPAGHTLSYAWSQLSGPVVALSSATAPQPTFSAPVVAAGTGSVTLLFSLVVDDGIAASAPATVMVSVYEATAMPTGSPGVPSPAPYDPNPPLAGANGSHRLEIGAAQGLYIVDPAAGEPTVQGFVVVGVVSPIGTLPPDFVVTINGTPILRDPKLNGNWFRVDPSAVQPVVHSGGSLVIQASGTLDGQAISRTLVLPCPTDIEVASSPAIGGALAAGSSVQVTSGSSVLLNAPGIPLMAANFPSAALYGYDPATRSLSPRLPGDKLLGGGNLDVTLPGSATASPGYLFDLRWPGIWQQDGETGGFCGLAKRWTYTK